MKYFILSLILLCCSVFVKGQNQYSAEPSPVLLKERWEAEWITCPESSLYDYGVYHFRKTLTLNSRLDSFIINISADNRYCLCVNGRPVCWGPARGGIYHWYFDTVDIAPLLRPGKNVLAVLVWNFGNYTPGAQMTLKTGLIVQGNTSLEAQANTDKSWKVYHDPAYSPSIEYLQDVGCSDILNASLYPWGWENLDYNDADWIEARTIGRGQPYGIGSGYDWILCKRDIPFLKKYDTKIIVNVCGHAPEEYLAVVERLADESIDMMEINISCPNVNAGFLAFGQDAKHVEELTAQIKKIAKQPIIMKLTPNVTDITEIAKAAEAGGADALSLINTLTGMKIDINRRTFAVANKTGGVSGPVVHPIAVRMVYQTAQAVNIPIIGMGGIATPEDAIEMILAGASAVSVGTANFYNPNATIEIIDGIEAYMKKNGFESVKDMVGIVK